MNAIEVLSRVYRLGRKMHPDYSLGAFKHQVLMLASAVINISTLRLWYGTADNPLLARAVDRYPLIEGAMYWPYINHKWTVDQSLQIIDKHYRILQTSPPIFSNATFVDTVLVDCKEEYPELKLVLEKAPWFLREGEIVLSMFVGIDRVYSVAFTLGVEDGHRVAYVGALQGRSIENAMEIYRNLTHALHGMRPRDFLISALKIVCKASGIEKIWGICSENRQHNGKYFSGSHKNKILADYDEVWREHNGVNLGNGFYSLSTVLVYREFSEMPARKRANYKRRYSMLNKLVVNIDEAIKSA